MQDRMDKILERLSQRIEEWEGASVEAIENESRLKSWEAITKKAFMDSGQSAAKAEVETRAGGQWAEYYRAVQLSSLKAEKFKRLITLGQLAFDAERTKQANLRRVV